MENMIKGSDSIICPNLEIICKEIYEILYIKLQDLKEHLID